MSGILCGGVLFNEITRIMSRPATLVKKTSTKEVYLLYIRTFSSSAGRSYMSSNFLIKWRVRYYRAATSLKLWSTIAFFHKKKSFSLFILFKTASFWYRPKKNLCWVLFIVKLQSEYFRLVTLLKETPSWKFSCKIFNLSQSTIFRNIIICAEEENYIKDYMKAKR